MGMFSNLTIGKRLGLGFGVTLLLIVGMAVTGFVGAARLSAESRTIYEDRTVPLGELSTIYQLMMSNRVLVMNTLLAPQSLAQNRTQVEANAARIGQIWKRFMASQMTPREAQLAQAYEPARAAYVNDGLLAVLAAVGQGDLENARLIYRDKLEPLAQSAIGLSDQLIQLQIDVAGEEYRRAQALESLVETTMAVAAGLALLLGVSSFSVQ